MDIQREGRARWFTVGLASATGEICRDLCRYKAVATLERDTVYDITSVIPVKWPVSSQCFRNLLCARTLFSDQIQHVELLQPGLVNAGGLVSALRIVSWFNTFLKYLLQYARILVAYAALRCTLRCYIFSVIKPNREPNLANVCSNIHAFMCMKHF